MSGHATMATTSTRMYPVQPLVVLSAKFPHSSSMYKMRNIHEDTVDTRPCRHDAANTTATEAKMPDDAVVSQAPLPEYGLLEARQEKILNQLAELKKQVSTLCHFLKQSNQMEMKQSNQTEVKDSVEVQKPIVNHLVLNVNPKKPPYSILALQKLWKDTHFNVISHIHSTTKDDIPIVFPKWILSSKKAIQLTLIWKDVPDMEVIVNTYSCPIRGEVNFLRLMSRLIESHNYESTCSQPQTLDFALDFTNFLHSQKCIKEGLITLANEFEKWSCKGGFNIVDIAVWSLIKQFHETDLPPVLRKWYIRCESFFTDY
ncbi:PREDICTED: aminoacyl tRNA synthase complex-interacting multifunctional protein 2-like isoform X2 [Cyphomyrmex costatus]|uniref:Putative aminoacyl tRNA synthase complex-interacting multifunctional protein 2 n=1 Tax=Cyphomyrmex costatus TaxID=456900 RepID=A0A195C646_9HYME|nr:PREDICTED: aminoacyl tRNA synthase complex-interacting multifunctional protein 2-like isoform X2 [Cyphomyrmex costatus]KYM95646.1 putative aminoacyl tRNA synthase complex-interacting multifunctional protein 2 [Cyphomyrmex costatus]